MEKRKTRQDAVDPSPLLATLLLWNAEAASQCGDRAAEMERNAILRREAGGGVDVCTSM
jgi:hypothetical protein